MATTDNAPVPAAPTADPNEYLTMAEIEKRFDKQWVLIDRPKKKFGPVLLGGYVICHSPDRDAIDRAGLALPAPIDIAILFMGDAFDEDEEVIL